MTTPQAAAPHESYASRFSFRPVALGRRGMVASANPLATLAGLKILARGGNAVDALVATAAAVGVAEPYMSGLAGCGVLVLTRPGHRPKVLNFLGRAPSGTTREKMHGANHTSGPLSVAVPGNLAGWARVLADHGTLPLAEVLEPAAELAEAGPPLTPFDKTMFDEHLTYLDAEAARNYLRGGHTPAIGTPLAQPNLAASFRRIGREGLDVVYGGALGDGIVGALGGLMTKKDLQSYPERLRWEDPLSTTYRDVEVFAPPPPSSGSQVIQTLNGMGGWDVGSLAHLGPDHLAVIAEAARVARMDTHRHIGDPDVVTVPIERLMSHARTEEIRAEMRARLDAPRHPVAVAGGSGGDSGASTTHLAAMDASGLAVNVTQSLGNGFGSGIVVPGTGICLNNALHWTSTDAGHPNVVQPGKRHEWPVAPIHLFRGGKLWGTVGTPGSYGILVTTVQVICNLIDFGLSVQDAIGAPRFRWLDEAIDRLPAETIRIESRVPEATRRELAARGYAMEVMGAWSMRVGGVQAILRDDTSGWLMGGADPRRNGYAMGW